MTEARDRRAVFLDRDGVLNRVVLRNGRPHPPDTVDAMELTPGVEGALLDLKRQDLLLFVVTNQPDVARGHQERATIDAMHAKLKAALPLDGVYVCFHDDVEACDCRKPKAGLLLQAAAEHGVSVPDSYMVGDRWRDVEAGQSAGCRTVWIDCSYAERGPSTPPDVVVHSLPEAAAWIVNAEQKRTQNNR